MKQKLTIILAVVLVMLFLGITNLNSLVALAQNVACYTQQGGANVVAGSGCTYNFKSGSTLQIDSGATVTRDGLTDYASTRGAASAVTNNTLVAHGLGTTPTIIMLTPFFAGSLTNTLYISATNATSFTVGLGQSTGQITITSVYWQAQK